MSIEAITTTGNWHLPEELIKLSQHQNWDEASKEWDLTNIEMLAPGEESSSCLCGHEIRELCHISNSTTKKTAIVGNHCIWKFPKMHPLTSVPKIIQATHRLMKDPLSSANKDLIQLAFSRNIFTQSETSFYLNIWRKRQLTEDQATKKTALNQKLFQELIRAPLEVELSFITKDPIKSSASPRLIQRAHDQNVLRDRDAEFYNNIWRRSNASLSEKQLAWKIDLNRRMVTKLT